MGQDFPISHSFYYKRTTVRAPLCTGFKGSRISWCATSVPEVLLFLLLLIASKTHVNKAVGKRPSLTLTVSDNTPNFSVTPFFWLPHHTVVTSATACEEGSQSPPKTSVMPQFGRACPSSSSWCTTSSWHCCPGRGQVLLGKGTPRCCSQTDLGEHSICCNDAFYYLQESGLA